MKIQYISGRIDVSHLENINVLVCPTDEYLSGSGGLDQAIREAAGPELTEELHTKKLSAGEVLFTKGYGLAAEYIAHVAVPRYKGDSEDITPLRAAYQNLLVQIRDLYDNGTCKTVTMTLIGTGSCGWSFENSMKALWLEILDYHRHHGSSYMGAKDTVEKLLLYYPMDAFKAVSPYFKRASQAFFNAPDQWGYRGDPYFWYDLMEYFDDPKFDRLTPDALISEVQRFFHKKTGTWLCGDTEVKLEEYAHGGMSSGGISNFMATIGIPLLCSNLVNLGFLEDYQPHFVIPVELYSVHQEKYQLKLPYELLPELTYLRQKKDKMNDQQRISLSFTDPYYLTVHHYHNRPELIDFYSLDAENANDSHYQFIEENAAALCKKLGYKPVALGAALKNYLQKHGGAALERLIHSIADQEFHY